MTTESVPFTVHAIEDILHQVANANDYAILDSVFMIKLDETLSRHDTGDISYLILIIASRCITYADNRSLFKLLSAFCLDSIQKYRIGKRYYQIEFRQELGYSPKRLREDDMTAFLIALYNSGYVIMKEHQHFFSEEYQMFVEL